MRSAFLIPLRIRIEETQEKNIEDFESRNEWDFSIDILYLNSRSSIPKYYSDFVEDHSLARKKIIFPRPTFILPSPSLPLNRNSNSNLEPWPTQATNTTPSKAPTTTSAPPPSPSSSAKMCIPPSRRTSRMHASSSSHAAPGSTPIPSYPGAHSLCSASTSAPS